MSLFFPPPLTCVKRTFGFPSCGSGSVKPQALQGEVGKMLEKGRSFRYGLLQQVVPGAEGYRRIVSVILTKFTMETMSSVLGSIRKGDLMFSIDLNDAYFQILILPDSRPYRWITLEGKVYQFRALMFLTSLWLPRSSPGCSPWSWSGLIGEISIYSIIWTTG